VSRATDTFWAKITPNSVHLKFAGWHGGAFSTSSYGGSRENLADI